MQPEPKAVIEQIAAAKRWIKRAQGKFSAFVFAKEVGIQDVQLRDQVLDELVVQNMLDRDASRNGWYHRIDSMPEPTDWMDAEVEVAPIILPLGLNDLAYISPGNIIVLAGESNSGKTAFAMNTLYANLMQNGGCYERVRYLNSEMHPAEFKGRAFSLDSRREAWAGLELIPRTRDFHHVIDPNGLNIIDYLENLDDFWAVGKKIEDIHNRLESGVVLICLQKKKGLELARGGDFTLEKARLALSMFWDGWANYLRITKCKFPVQYPNPQGQEMDFTIEHGGVFQPIPDCGWQWVTADQRAARTRTRESAARLSALNTNSRGFCG